MYINPTDYSHINDRQTSVNCNFLDLLPQHIQLLSYMRILHPECLYMASHQAIDIRHEKWQTRASDRLQHGFWEKSGRQLNIRHNLYNVEKKAPDDVVLLRASPLNHTRIVHHIGNFERRVEVPLQHVDDRVDTVFEILNVPLIILEHALNNAFDDLRVRVAVNSDDIVELSDIEKPVIINELLVKIQGEELFFALGVLAQPKEKLEHCTQ